MKRNVVLALAVAAAVAAPGAFATTGYFSHGYSMKEKGMAGTGVAFAQDALAAATNPAGMVMVGNRMDVGVALFSPLREYSTSGAPSGGPGTFPIAPYMGGTVESDNTLFLIPNFGRNWMLDANSSIGLSIYANGGMNTKWNAADTGGPGVFSSAAFGLGDGTAGVDLAQMFFSGTYASKMSSTSSWGASVIFAYQKFKAYGLETFGGFSSDASNLTNNGYDDSTGFGLKVGVQGEVSPGISLGASYQSEIAMSEFDKYKGLFAEQGDFDIPATANAGLAWKITPTSVLTFEIQKIWYSKVKAVGNPLMPNLGTAFLGDSGGAGFGWKDVDIFRLGYQWESSPGMTWRVGYIDNDQPIASSEVLFNILAPAVQEQHITFGLTKQMDKNNELTFAAMYSPEEKVSGPNPLEAPGAQTIELKMKQYELGVAWGWKF
jgi:long-chain fatty acid transport protein